MKKFIKTLCLVFSVVLFCSSVSYAAEKHTITKQIEVIEMYCDGCKKAIVDNMKKADDQIKALNGEYSYVMEVKGDKYPDTFLTDKNLKGQEIKYGYMALTVKADTKENAEKVFEILVEKIGTAPFYKEIKKAFVFDSISNREFEHSVSKTFKVKNILNENQKNKISSELDKIEESMNLVVFEEFNNDNKEVFIKILKGKEALLDTVIKAIINNANNNIDKELVITDDAALSFEKESKVVSDTKTKLMNEVSELAKNVSSKILKKAQDNKDSEYYMFAWMEDYLNKIIVSFDSPEKLKEFNEKQLNNLKSTLKEFDVFFVNNIDDYKVNANSLLEFFQEQKKYTIGENDFDELLKYRDAYLENAKKEGKNINQAMFELTNKIYKTESYNNPVNFVENYLKKLNTALWIFKDDISYNVFLNKFNSMTEALKKYPVTLDQPIKENEQFQKDLADAKSSNDAEKISYLEKIQDYSENDKLILTFQKDKLADMVVPYKERAIARNIVYIKLVKIRLPFMYTNLKEASEYANTLLNYSKSSNKDSKVLDELNKAFDEYFTAILTNDIDCWGKLDEELKKNDDSVKLLKEKKDAFLALLKKNNITNVETKTNKIKVENTTNNKRHLVNTGIASTSTVVIMLSAFGVAITNKKRK